MIAANIAPGMNRSFLAEDWKNIIGRKCWYEAMDEANDLVDDSVQVDIQGYDIDGDIVKAARLNAQSAGVDHMIHFQQRPVSALSHPKKYGFIISNPPYGERIEEKKNLPVLYREIGERFAALDAWSMYLITSYEDTEKCIGRKADKNRKIYNGMLKTYFYQFMGPKPPRRSQEKKIDKQNRRALGAVLAVCIAVMTAGCAVLADKRSPDSSFGYEDVRERKQNKRSRAFLPFRRWERRMLPARFGTGGFLRIQFCPVPMITGRKDVRPRLEIRALLEPAGPLPP